MYWGLAVNLSSQHFGLTCIYFEGVIGISYSTLKWFRPVEKSLGNLSTFQFWSKKKPGTQPSPGATLTIWLRDMFGPSTLHITAGKGEEDFNSLSSNLSFVSLNHHHNQPDHFY